MAAPACSVSCSGSISQKVLAGSRVPVLVLPEKA
jgi:hypothetical protein